MSAEAAECKQPGTSPPPSAINARGPAGDILTISAAATTGEFIVFTQFMITMAISGRHGHLLHDRSGADGQVRRAVLRCFVAGHDSLCFFCRRVRPVRRRGVGCSMDSSVVVKFDLSRAIG